MCSTVAILLFCGGLLLSLMSSVVLSERLDQVGHRLRLPPGLIGLVAALGADSPEIASAAAAIIGGQHDLGRGVIFGSNIFNVAMLLGLSAVVAGRVAMSRVREPHKRERPRHRRLLREAAWPTRRSGSGPNPVPDSVRRLLLPDTYRLPRPAWPEACGLRAA